MEISKETLALALLKNQLDKNYDELNDALYYYMLTYLENNMIENCLFRDEVENLLGIRNHEEITNYIFNNQGGEW